MKYLERYYTLYEKGETTFPSQLDIQEFEKHGIQPMLLLDSSICLDSVIFADYKRKAKVDKTKLINYLEYVHKTPIEIISFLGILELCHNQQTMEIDIDRFRDFKNRINFLEQLPLKIINSCQFDFQRDYKILNKLNFETNSIDTFKPLLLNTYCCLLKIRELSLNGLGKEKAKKNIENYIDWTANDLGRMMGIEQQLAMNVFGGTDEFRAMIALDGNKQKTKKMLWATSWDIFHFRISCNNIKISKYLGKNIHSIFVTKDFNLYKLISQLNLTAIFDDSNEGITTSIIMASYEYKHFEPSYVDTLNNKIINLLSERVSLKKGFDEIKLNSLIKDLELRNQIV
jgi:hypothetical protein